MPSDPQHLRHVVALARVTGRELLDGGSPAGVQVDEEEQRARGDTGPSQGGRGSDLGHSLLWRTIAKWVSKGMLGVAGGGGR